MHRRKKTMYNNRFITPWENHHVWDFDIIIIYPNIVIVNRTEIRPTGSGNCIYNIAYSQCSKSVMRAIIVKASESSQVRQHQSCMITIIIILRECMQLYYDIRYLSRYIR